MPHLPQPVRARAVAINRVVRRAAQSRLPEVQAPDMKAAARDDAIISDVDMLASGPEN